MLLINQLRFVLFSLRDLYNNSYNKIYCCSTTSNLCITKSPSNLCITKLDIALVVKL